MRKVRKVLVLVLLAAPGIVQAQEFRYRGFAELRSIVYPLATPQDDDRVSLEGRVRIDPTLKLAPWLALSGSLEGRLDSIEQVERRMRPDWLDRRLRRPAINIRQAEAAFRRRGVSVSAGKQFIRWGKADILNPTDRFAPRDFVEVTNDEFLAVTAARAQYEIDSQSFDIVWTPAFTPSRIPLIGKRWSAPTPQTAFPVVATDGSFPSRGQYGARWNVVGPGFEISASYFDGFNHLPQFVTDLPFLETAAPFVALRRSYAPIRMIGTDAAWPLRWFTLKGEAGRFTTSSSTADDLLLYVIQIERQSGELSLVGGYAGEIVTTRRAQFDFAPDRGLTRAFLGRAGYTIDARRDVSIEAAVRQTLKGAWVKAQYSEAYGAHWRLTVGGAVIAGRDDDFFGQYRRNSHVLVTMRYSF